MPTPPTTPPRLLTPTTITEVSAEAEAELAVLDPLTERVHALEVRSDESYQILMGQGRLARDTRRRIEARQNPLIKLVTRQATELKREIKDLFNPMLNACDEVLEIVDTKRRGYETWQAEQHRIAERKRLAEVAAERKRLAEEAEIAAMEEQERLDNIAAEAAKHASTPEVQQTILTSVPEVAPEPVPEVVTQHVAPPTAPKVSGATVAKVWEFEITNPEAVSEYFGDIPLWERRFSRTGLLKARAALSTGPDDQPIPGVRFYQKDQPRYGRL